MTLKVATIEDYPVVMDMARKFYENSPYHGVVDYDDSKISDIVISLLETSAADRIGILAIDDETGEPVGMILGQVTETIFNRKRVATELAWWMDPDHRATRTSLELINAFEYWAKHKANCTYVQLATVETEQVERIAKFYKRKQYDIYERCFLKVIN